MGKKSASKIESAEEKARKRVKEKKEFYQHLASYIAVGAFFFILNAVTSFGVWWFHYPMLGWGIGLVIHYFNVFGIPGIVQYDDEWEERAVEKELRKIQRNRGEALPTAPELELKDLEKIPASPKKWDDSELV